MMSANIIPFVAVLLMLVTIWIALRRR